MERSVVAEIGHRRLLDLYRKVATIFSLKRIFCVFVYGMDL